MADRWEPFYPSNPKHVRPWAIIAEARQDGRIAVITQEGEILRRYAPRTSLELLASLHGSHVLACAVMRPVLQGTGVNGWVVKRRGASILSYRHDEGFRVVYLPASVPYGFDGAMMVGKYLDALSEYGVGLTHRATWTTLAKHLHTATLPRVFPAPRSEIAREGFYGGRKQAFRCQRRHAVYYDLSASYVNASAARDLPLRLREVDCASQSIPADVDGIVAATVMVPNRYAQWAPLPMRLHPLVDQLHYPWGQLSGWWSIAELREVMRYGVELLYVHEMHIGDSEVDLFGTFARETRKLRRNRDFAAIAKEHANSVWSMFATRPIATLYSRVREVYPRLRFRDEKKVEAKDFTARGAFVSSIISARVRTRLFTEGLFPEGDERHDAVYCDTDGFIAGRSRRPEGDDWRAKKMLHVRIYDEGLYEYRCVGCGVEHAPGHAVASGIRSEYVARELIRKGRQSVENEDVEESERAPERSSARVP